mgnify:CR=1 FL=1
MAQVIVTLKIMPKDVEINLDELEKKIRDKINPEKVEREPIAFGLVALKIIKIIPDAGGELEKIENGIKSIEGVGGVEVVGVTRTL